MSEAHTPLADRLHEWLRNARIDYYLCNHCNGLHLSALQGLAGVVESRLFVEEWGLLISTEYVVRPTAILPLATDLGRLNAGYPSLKLFLDIIDDAMPQLVAGSTVLTGAGISEAQFVLFVTTAQELMSSLVSELAELDFLLPEEGQQLAPSRQFH